MILIAFLDMDLEEGGDNRNLVDDGTAQSMTTEEIAELKSQGMKGMDLISSLIQNSSTFGQRQEYAKKKYVEKKKDRLVVLRMSHIQGASGKCVHGHSVVSCESNALKIIDIIVGSKVTSNGQLLSRAEYCDYGPVFGGPVGK